jgi:hypothetical protein
MRHLAVLVLALPLAACNANQPDISAGTSTFSSAKPVQEVAGCISQAFMGADRPVRSADLPGGRSILVGSVDTVVRADVISSGGRTQVVFNPHAFLKSTYEPLVVACL